MNRRRLALALVPLALALSACSTIDVAPRAELDRSMRWVVLPLINHTETPGAGQRASAVVETVLRTRGISDVQGAPVALSAETLFEAADAQAQLQDKALAWARASGARYAVGGTVTEWRYKVGVDGEPAVGLTLQVIDLATGRVVWSAAGGRTGWSREALSAVAQKLARDLTAALAR
jgi:PBP1b-binding outer membrane lipoprotein LpoB